MGFSHPAHPWDNDELRDFYRRDADAEDKALAHEASRQPRGTAAPSPTPQALTSSAPEGRDATPLKDRAAYVKDWLDECDGGPMRQRLLALMAELRFEQGLDRYADEGTK